MFMAATCVLLICKVDGLIANVGQGTAHGLRFVLQSPKSLIKEF